MAADSIRVSLPEGEGEPQDDARSTEDHHTGSSEVHRPQKRRRIPVACGACRSKKSRCDGYRPKCSSCQAQNIECVYLSPPISATTPVPRAFLQLVETRLSQLESDVRSLKDQAPPPGSRSVRSEPIMHRRDSVNVYRVVPEPDEPDHDGDDGDDDDNDADDDDDDYGVSPDATDGMGSIEFTREEDSGYYGPSSNIAFTRNIRRALYALLSRPSSNTRHQHEQAQHGSDDTTTTTTTTTTTLRTPSHRLDAMAPSGPSLEVSRPATPHRRRPSSRRQHHHPIMHSTAADAADDDYLRLPPEDEMHALVGRFFADTGALFPFVHGPSFMATYARAQAGGFRRFRRSWLGLLNAILAMATVTGGGGAERAARAEVFYARAKALCLEQMLNSASLETVQAMLLMSQYLQGTYRSTTTWNVHGLAVKAAFQLGLHSTGFDAASHSPLDREMRLRTWYGCVVLDRTLSMTFGRPPAIPESYVRTPLPKACGTSVVEQRLDDQSLSTDFYVYTITLYKILWSIIDLLYECNIGPPDNNGSVLPVASHILQIEHQLLEWQSTLAPPSSLVAAHDLVHDDGVDYPPERRFRVILTLRFHNARILAHRRILDLYLASVAEAAGGTYPAMLAQVGQRSRAVCLQSAAELIGIVGALLTGGRAARAGLLGAWWFTLYYTFNATLTIVALSLCDHVDGGGGGDEQPTAYDTVGISKQALADALAQALACLPLIDRGNKMVDKCAKFAATLSHCLQILDGRAGPGAGAAAVVAETPRMHQYGAQVPHVPPPPPPYSYAPIPIDVSHFDLGALGWDNDGFLASLGSGMGDGFQETDLFI